MGVAMVAAAVLAPQPPPPPAYLRVTLLASGNATAPSLSAHVGVWVHRYVTMDDNCGTLALNRNGSVTDFGRGPSTVVDWATLDPSQALRVGEATGWADVSAALSPSLALVNGEVPNGPPIPDPIDYRRILAVTFNSPSLPPPMPASRFDGNLPGVRARLELASAPSAAAVVWSGEVASERGLAALTLFGDASATATDTQIFTLQGYAERCERLIVDHAQAASRRLDSAPPVLPRRITTAAMARDRAWPTDPVGLFDRNATISFARFLGAAGVNRAGGLHSLRPSDVPGITAAFGQFEAVSAATIRS